jgi:hypothetical protein
MVNAVTSKLDPASRDLRGHAWDPRFVVRTEAMTFVESEIRSTRMVRVKLVDLRTVMSGEKLLGCASLGAGASLGDRCFAEGRRLLEAVKVLQWRVPD